jgi:uncharacterized membrane protein YfcA
MDLNITQFLIVCPLVFLAGFVDSIAGGGGLISLPAYLLAGVPVHNAIATNKLSSCIGTTVSTARYLKNKYADYVIAIPSIIVALLGSALGAQISVKVDEDILKRILIFVLPLVAYFVLRRKKDRLSAEKERILSRKLVIVLAVLCSFFVGAYDGFYGPGTGTFLILLYTNLCKLDIKTASGNTKLVNLSSNIAALVIFLVNGKTLFLLGLIAAAFCMAGHYLGSGLVMKKGTQIVKPIILVVLLLLFIKMMDWKMIF